MLSKLRRKRKGQALIEYAFLLGGIAFICLVAVSVFGHKLADQYAVSAGMLPGAHGEDNLAIGTSFFAEVTSNGGTSLTGNGRVSWDDITGNTTLGELDNNVVTAGTSGTLAFVAEFD